MILAEGTPRQRALFAALLAVPLLGLGLAVADKLERIGQPNIGWLTDDTTVSPTRADTSDAGLRGGGRALRINGTAVTTDTHAAAAAGEILISSRVYGELAEHYRIESVGEMSLKGFHQAQLVYRLVGVEEPARARR
jgi:hypothetical protein